MGDAAGAGGRRRAARPRRGLGSLCRPEGPPSGSASDGGEAGASGLGGLGGGAEGCGGGAAGAGGERTGDGGDDGVVVLVVRPQPSLGSAKGHRRGGARSRASVESGVVQLDLHPQCRLRPGRAPAPAGTVVAVAPKQAPIGGVRPAPRPRAGRVVVVGVRPRLSRRGGGLERRGDGVPGEGRRNPDDGDVARQAADLRRERAWW